MPSLDHPRFIAKRDRDDWRVYDRRRATYPLVVPGFGTLQSHAIEQDATEEADRLAAFYSKAMSA